MESQPTRFNRENPMRILFELNAYERQYVIAMAHRLGISIMQAARRHVQEKEQASKR